MRLLAALVMALFVVNLGCDTLGLSGKKEKVSSSDDADDDDDDDDDDKKKDKKKKHKKKDKKKDKKKSSDDDDDDDDDKADDADDDDDDDKADDDDDDDEPAGESFAGTYRSTWGDTVMRQKGNTVSATYPGGVLTCTPKDKDLDCDWKEGALVGKAALKKQANGDLDGRWGNGASATNGGRWLFKLKEAGDPGVQDSDAAEGSFAGVYQSTWGDTTFFETGGRVSGRYPGGTLDCTPTGAKLDCSWKEGAAVGRAALTRQANGDIKGRWGNGASDTNGGSWLFRKK